MTDRKPRHSCRIRHEIALLTFVSLAATAGIALSDEKNTARNATSVDYRREIEPILAARCFRCHGRRKQEAGLRLDVRDRALAGGDSGVVITPGSSATSELLRRVASTDPDQRMPPDGDGLERAEIELLRTWIDQGATGIPRTAGDIAESHWAFRPIRRPLLPAVSDTAWCENHIDRFVLRRLDRQQIAPSSVAPRETLVRRLSFDLVGLPPKWAAVERFISDDRPDAWERLVDRVLASPHYGERWGRHWLDLARYADSTGYESDNPRQIWLYRDWVIGALNGDMAFDRFVVEQLAGDLLPDATVGQRIATGFHCNAMLDPGVRWESVIDRVNTTGTVFLGLTFGCAQCHSHKTDPLTQREFYRLYAFFNEATISSLEFESPDPDKPVATLVMKHTPQPTHIFVRGDPAQPADRVEPGFPQAFAWQPASPNADGGPVSKHSDRRDLAQWIVAPGNPLTARVTVNRIWQRYFGLGLVETENDFGVQTPPPSHPELLDRLAFDFRSDGWGLKKLHRLIVTSSTYRQSSNARHDMDEVDPRNRLLARQRRLRLEAEVIRDVWLSAGGLLTHQIGGPSVFPWQPDGVLDNRATPATWTVSTAGDRYRRGLYTWVWRLTPHPHMPLFNGPDGVTACTRRDRSNVPVQALTLLNDPTFHACAQSLAYRLRAAADSADTDRCRLLFHTCLSRRPRTDELSIVLRLLEGQRRELRQHLDQARLLLGGGGISDASAVHEAAWVVVCRTVMNTDEFITRE